MNADTLAKVQRALQDLQPAEVVVRQADGAEQVLAPGGPRKKWVAVLHALQQLTWESLYLRDAKGRTLGPPIANDGAATSLEPLSATGTALAIQGVAQLAQISSRTAQAQLEWFATILKPTLDCATGLSKEALAQSAVTRDDNNRLRQQIVELEAELKASRSKRMALEQRIGRLVQAHESADEKQWSEQVKALVEVAPDALRLVAIAKNLLTGGKT